MEEMQKSSDFVLRLLPQIHAIDTRMFFYPREFKGMVIVQ